MNPILNVLETFYRYPKSLLVAVLLLIGLLCTQLPNLRLDASADALVLEGDEALEVFRKVSEKYGADEFLVATFSPNESLFDGAALNTIAKLKQDLLSISDVTSVTTILDVPLLYSPPVQMSELEEGINYLSNPSIDKALAKSEFLSSPLYSQLLTSQNFDTTAIQINLKRDEHFFNLLNKRDELAALKREGRLLASQNADLEQAEVAFSDYSTIARERQDELILKVRSALLKYDQEGTFFLGGVPMIASDMISFIRSDLVVFGAGILIFIVLLLAVIFRNWVWIILPLGTCVLTAAGMLGLITSLDWTLTVISSNFVPLLLIITLSITIHLAVRFREVSQSDNKSDASEAVISTVRLMLRPCLYTALTTVIAFASLVVSGIRPVIDFGWMMTIGVSAALLISFLLIPSLLIMLPLKQSQTSVTRPQGKSITRHFATFADQHGNWVWALSGILVIFSIFGITRLEVENRFIDYFDDSTEIYQGMELIDQKLGGTIPLDIILRASDAPDSQAVNVSASVKGRAEESVEQSIDESESLDVIDFDVFDDGFDSMSEIEATNPIPGYWFTRHGLKKIESIHQYLDSIEATGKVLSLASIYQVLKDVTQSDVDDFQLALIGKNLPDEIKQALIWPYLSEDGDEARLSIRVKETSYELQRDKLIHDIEVFLQEEQGFEPAQYDMTGMLVLYNNMLQSLFSSQIQTLGAVFIAITLMFTILFRSLYLALIAVAPNLLAAGVVLGGMGVFGIPLDMMTITIAAITIGIGVDDTIHYIHRFKEEFVKDKDYAATMYRCHSSIGRAMLYTSIIIIIGFSILTLSNFTPTIYFGLLTGVAMFSALMGALLLLPRLMITLKPLGS